MTSDQWNRTTSTLDFSQGGGAGPSASATLTTSLTGDNNDIVFTAADAGSAGNLITIEYVDPEAVDAELGVVVTGTAIVVNLATDGSGDIVSTADEVKAAIEGDEDADALVTVADAGGNDGSGVVTELAETALAGGGDGTYRVFEVVGMVRTRVAAHCLEDLAGASATLSLGTAVSAAALLASTTSTEIDAGDIWHDNSPDAGIEASSVAVERLLTGDIILTAGTAVTTAGKVAITIEWQPFSEGSKVSLDQDLAIGTN